jgi:hypothetical protein
MSSGFTEEEPSAFSFFSLSKVPVKNPSRVPNKTLWRELPAYKALFYKSLKFRIKIPLSEEIYPFSQRP